ncbi:MAG: redoxin domain-containing protein, partial [Anaerolineae bacterium]|nr:redoxin domain-containing protein [Anaerolineae bacterium]
MLRHAAPLFSGLLIGVGIGAAIIIGNSSESISPKINQSSDYLPPTTGLEVGEIAPNFELKSLDGELINLKDLRGKPVVINFWATWCGPCRLEMPAFQDRFEKNHGNLQILAVNFDESQEEVDAFVDEYELSFSIVLDPDSKVQQLYQVRG